MAVTVVTTMPATGTGAVIIGQPTGVDLTIPAISGYVPQLGDVVFVFGNCESQTTSVMTPAEWAVAGATVASTTNLAFVRGHAVTESEVAAGTNTWVIPGLFGTAPSGWALGVVVRGGDFSQTVTAGVVDVAGNVNVVPASVTPQRDGSLVLAYVAPDDRQRSVSDPSSGWSVLRKTSGVANVVAQLLSRRLVNAAGGVAVDMTNAAVTLNSSDGWASITVAISPPASTSGFFAVFS